MADSTIFCQSLLGEAGWVHNVRLRVSEEGLIESLEPGDANSTDVTLDGPVIPGMPNCHSHAFQRQMAGLAGFAGSDRRDSFWTWREIMYRLANRLDPDQFEAIAHWLYVEMLEAGYTSCAEFHYLHHQADGTRYSEPHELGNRLLNAASQAGIALTLVPVLYCRSGFESESVSSEQRRFANDPAQFMALFEGCLSQAAGNSDQNVGLGLHSLRAVSESQMAEVLDAESGRASAIHIHVAEQPAEVNQCLAAYGARPVEWLLDHATVDDRWCLVHATHMIESEYENLARSRAVAGLCPTTEADLGDGFFEGAQFLGLGGRIAIGSDSNLRISPTEELRLLEFGLRLRTGRRNVMTAGEAGCGETLYRSALDGGAAALGQPAGVLAPGRRADFVELDSSHPMLRGVNDKDVLDRYVFAGGQGMIRSVFVSGREKVRNGFHVGREQAAERYSAVMEELGQ